MANGILFFLDYNIVVARKGSIFIDFVKHHQKLFGG